MDALDRDLPAWMGARIADEPPSVGAPAEYNDGAYEPTGFLDPDGHRDPHQAARASMTRADMERARLIASKNETVQRLKAARMAREEALRDRDDERRERVKAMAAKSRNSRGKVSDERAAWSLSVAQERRHQYELDEQVRWHNREVFERSQQERVAASEKQRLAMRLSREALMAHNSNQAGRNIQQRLELCVEAAKDEADVMAQRMTHASKERVARSERIKRAVEENRADRALVVQQMHEQREDHEEMIALRREEKKQLRHVTLSPQQLNSILLADTKRKRALSSGMRRRQREVEALANERQAEEMAYRQRMHDRVLLSKYHEGPSVPVGVRVARANVAEQAVRV